MNDFLKKFLQINPRVIILTLVFLVAFDAALQGFILPGYLNPARSSQASGTATFPAPVVRRLPADDAETLALWKQQLAYYKGFKVVFLGDSVVHGGGVPGEADTIPAQFSRQLQMLLPDRDFKVFNFSLPGCTPADTYNILNYIIDSQPDLIIYDLNIGWFGSPTYAEHPRLAELYSKGDESNPAAGPPAQKSLSEFKPEEFLTRQLSSHWSLYRNRVLLNYMWFGEPLRDKLKVSGSAKGKSDPAGAHIIAEEAVYQPWYKKNFDVLRQSEGKLGSVSLDNSNPHWLVYNRLVQLLGSKSVPAIFFTAPRNKTLYMKYDLLDERLLEKVQGQLGNRARKREIQVYDFTYKVEDRFFTDTVHLTAEGNRKIAELLAWNTANSGVVK